MKKGFKNMLDESMPEMPQSFSQRIDDTLGSLETVSINQKAKASAIRYVCLGLAAAACIMFLVLALPALIKAPEDVSEIAQASPAPEQLAVSDEPKLPDAYSQRLADIAYQVDDWIYYVYDGIYKINANGTENTKVNDDRAGWLQVSDGWLYYTCYSDKDVILDSTLVKTRLDGSERTVLDKGFTVWVTVQDDWVYYSDNSYDLFKIRTDGTEKTCLVKYANWPCITDDGWIYYSGANGNLFKIRTNGTENTLIYDENALYLNLDGDYIYYRREAEGPNGWEATLCRIKTDGTDESKIMDDFPTDYFAVEDNWIYYTDIHWDPNNQYNISDMYKIYSDGTEKQKLFVGDTMIGVPIVAGEWIYLMVDSNLYKIKTDGTEKQEVKLFSTQPEEQIIKEEKVAEETPETADFPKITETENVGAKDLIALFGEPDEIIDNMIKNPEAESIYLFYSKYNRVFASGEGYIWDVTYLFESFGGITAETEEKQVKDILGEPASKSEIEYEGEATMAWYQTWRYKDLGMNVIMKSNKKNMSNSWLGSIEINKESKIKLKSGIGIGSTKEEVISKYYVGIYPEDKIEDSFIRIGNTYDNILFDLEDGKVVGIRRGSYNN